MFGSTKKFGPYSTAFRQWLAQSHCKFVHGYGLTFQIWFEADNRDEHNWVVDFGALKPVKAILERWFDHTTVVAKDDPYLPTFQDMEKVGLIQLRTIDKVGCEAFAEFVYDLVNIWLYEQGYAKRVRIAKVEVWEHDINSAYFEPGLMKREENLVKR